MLGVVEQDAQIVSLDKPHINGLGNFIVLHFNH